MSELSDLTSQCIRCGFCLESCPTFVLTGRETESPRGRIYLARSADEGKIDWEETRHAFDTCLGCRACEPACPSGVQYGRILEESRHKLGAKRGVTKLVEGLSDWRKFRVQVALGQLWPGNRIPGFINKTLTDEPPEARLPQIPQRAQWPELDESELPPVRGEVAILEGCVMRVLYPHVHTALRRLLRRVGFSVREIDLGCCGALHAHTGQVEQAHTRLDQLVEKLPEGTPLIVDSAGCGSWIKEAPSPRSERLGRSTYDASEFLFTNGLLERLKASPGVPAVATYHDACHLFHGQRIKDAPRQLILNVPRLGFVELPEADMCCGSAGVYNLTQPGYARRLLDRKWANVESTGAQILVTGNPGCHSWIQQASDEHGERIRVVHTLELLEASFSGLVE